MHLIDTHCHLDLDAFEADRAETIERARAAGVDRLIIIGFAPERWPSTLALSHGDPGIFAAVGLHPTEAGRYDPALEAGIREAARDPRVCAIGETGLDYHWDTATPGDQRRAFERQIALAKELDLPFIVHQRKAEQDALDVLRATDPPHTGVMHCFTGGPDYAEACLDLGLHLGLGGAVTFRKAKALHEVVRTAPLDRLVLETDAPYMTPSPHRGTRNEPAYVRIIAEQVAALRGISVEEVAAATTANAERLFRLRQIAAQHG